MEYNGNGVYCQAPELEKMFIGVVTQLFNVGISPLITNDFTAWDFPHRFGVNLKDYPIDKPYDELIMEVSSCRLDSKSFQYWDDSHPSMDVDGLLSFHIIIRNYNKVAKINISFEMPVSFGMTYTGRNDFQWFLDSFTTNRKDYSVDNKLKCARNDSPLYDIVIDSIFPRQNIVLSTRDRIRRMNRLLFETWEFE